MSSQSNMKSASSRRLLAGQKLAFPPAGENIVISGMSGSFPNSDNITDFFNNLMNKMDLCDEKETRWAHTNPEIPRIGGKMISIAGFDAGYFGVHKYQANSMDPMLRILLGKCVEAVMDAGVNPIELRGTRTGVFIASGCMAGELDFYQNLTPKKFPITGSLRSIVPTRISYFFQVNGPSVVVDSACSSGLYALESAYRAIREGKCDRAIVGSNNMCTIPGVSLRFARLGVLNMNTGCRPFDQDGNGYTRSEAIVAIFLQKDKESKRIYAKIIHTKVNVDGYKDKGITFPSGKSQLLLYKDIYEECRVPPTSLAFIEAHGTGTKAGDPEELNAVDDIFCTGRDKPLIVGSVKGNIGHTECSSGLCAVVKVALGMDNGYIIPNIHFDNPRKDIDGLMKNRLQVTTDKMLWPTYSNFAGASSFGVGGANGHVLLERNEKVKIIPHDNNLPRLVCTSGRNIKSIEIIQNFLKSNVLDYEFVWLLQNIFSEETPNHLYRGFSVLNGNGEIARSNAFYDGSKKSIHLNIGNCNRYSLATINELSKIENFNKTIIKYKALQRNNIDVDFDEEKSKSILQQVIYATSVQLGAINILKLLNITFERIRGHSIGEFTSAYANDSISLEETILLSYHVTKILSENTASPNQIHVKIFDKLKQIIATRKDSYENIPTPKSNTFIYASPEYFLFNILNPTASLEIYEHLNNNTFVLNLDHERMVGGKNSKSLNFIQPSMKLEDLIINIGRLYEIGCQPQLHKLYPEIKTPLSRSTPMLSHLISWKEKNYAVEFHTKHKPTNEKHVGINLMFPEFSFYSDHVVDGRNFFPATGYLFLIWEFYAEILGKHFGNLKICFENIKLFRATTFDKSGQVNFYLSINNHGMFEVSQNNITLVTGMIKEVDSIDENTYCSSEDEGFPLMNRKDIYKEIRLRGYNHRGAFRAIHDMYGNSAHITWADNWVTFLDNMLQLLIFQEDNRSLYVPVGVDRLVIDAKNHVEHVKMFDNYNVPVQFDRKCRRVKSQYVEFCGLKPMAISRKRQMAEPVLESNLFIPNYYTTTIQNSIRINMQIILENKQMVNVKILEDITSRDQCVGNKPVIEEILKVLEDTPLMKADLTLLSEMELELKGSNIKIKNKKTNENHKNLLFVGYNLLTKRKMLQEAATTIMEDGFIISIETSRRNNILDNFCALTVHHVKNQVIYLLRKIRKTEHPLIIDVSEIENLNEWLEKLKRSIITSPNILLVAQNNCSSGILGFIKCIRQEPGGSKVKCLFLHGNGPSFDASETFYKDQLSKGMAINILRNNSWGTYRHLSLADDNCKPHNHFYADSLVRGDLSKLKWVQGYLNSSTAYLSNDKIIYVHYSPLNFKDVLLASGKIPVEAVTKDRRIYDRLFGIEFSGITGSGKRVMGVGDGTITNMLDYDTTVSWEVPPHWSLEEAATVPVIYGTSLFALVKRASLKRGQTVLIHSGTGGVGQAAINICQHFDCNIFTTVGTQEKREYLIKNYPKLKRSNIGNSRDTSFLEMIWRETNGRGVDAVLNSLSEDKLQASIQCLAKGGTFLEIGKFDLSKDNNLYLDLTRKGCAYYGIMLDTILKSGSKLLSSVTGLLNDGIKEGYVKPIPRMVFNKEQLEDAFRFMSAGIHMGKVLIKIHHDVDDKNVLQSITTPQFNSLPRFYCNPKYSYILLGGLGGFGLELADWLVLRRAKTIIFSTRTGATSGYQKSRLKIWKSYGINIIISLDDITTRKGCENVLNLANNVAPVGGIFNLAVILKDAVLSNQNEETMEISLGPKARATVYLDELSRKLCTNLEQFVVFSSASCGRGNAGQSNYGLSNSIMERVCEKRKKDGFPALAIQWGAIGDVGVLVEMQKENEVVIGGTIQQSIRSCLNVMDKLIAQNEAVVSSMVVAEKTGSSNASNVADAVRKIMGIQDLKTVSHHSTLSELGMDSMMVVEIRQTLERDYDIFLSAQDMRTLTFSKLFELNDCNEDVVKMHDGENVMQQSVNLIMNNIVLNITNEAITDLHSRDDNYGKVLILPGIDGNVLSFIKMAKHLEFQVKCAQYYSMQKQIVQVGDILEYLQPHARKYFCEQQKTFNIVAHSFGTIIALELAAILEKEGYMGKIVLLDGSPDLVMKLIKLFTDNVQTDIESTLISIVMESYIPKEKLLQLKYKLERADNFEKRKIITEDHLKDVATINKQVVIKIVEQGIGILKAILSYKPLRRKIQSKIIVLKPTSPAIKNVPDDLNLRKYCKNLIELKTFEGNHYTIIENEMVFVKTNSFFKS